MYKTRQQRVVALVAIILTAAAVARAGERAIELREWLDRTWKNQLVTYDFNAPEGTCHPQGVTLTGPDGPMPVQLHDIERWPDGVSVKHAKVSFITELLPRQTNDYKLQWAATPAEPLETDLTVDRAEDYVEIATAEFAARFALGEYRYEKPRAAGDVPAPVKELRLADGTWFGGSELYGPAKITGMSAEVTAEGPVFAEIKFTYEYEGDNRLNLTARLAAGDNTLFWDADVAKHMPDSGWRMILDKGLPEILFPVKIENHSFRQCVLDGERHPFRYHQPIRDLKVYSLNEEEPGLFKNEPAQYGIGEPGLIYKLTPWNDWWSDYTGTRFELWIPEKTTRFEFSNVDPGAWVKPLPPGQARNWGVVKPKMMALKKTDDGKIVFEMNLAAGEVGGVRRWSFGAGPLNESIVSAENIMDLKNARILGKGPVPRVGRRLNTVKDYILHWPADPEHPHPRLFVTEADLDDFRGRHDAEEIAPEIMAKVDGIASADLERKPQRNDTYALAAWLLTGDVELGRKLKMGERLETRLGLLGGFDKMRHTLAVLTLYDGVIDSPLVSDEDRPYLRAQAAYLAYQLNDPGTWSIERGYKSGNANMSISYLTNRGCLAAALRDHPMAEEWAKSPIGWMQTWLTRYIGPNGEWRESHHYVHVSFDAVMAFVLAAKQADLHDFFADSKLKDLFLYLGKMMYTPPDPQRHNQRVTAPMGRRPSGEPWALTGFAAKATEESDPEFSQAMQFVWKGTGFSRRVTDARYGGFEYVLLDPGLPAANPGWGTERFPWWGVVMNQGYGTDHHHYVNVLLPGHGWKSLGAHGSVVKYFSMGTPVGGAFAGTYDVTPNMGVRQELLQNRVVLARDWTDWKDFFHRFGRKNSLRESVLTSQPPLDYLRANMRMHNHEALWGSDRVDRAMELPPDLVKWPPVEKRGKAPVDWDRQLMFVKSKTADEPGYLVFRDTIGANQPTMWQFWTLSQKIGTPEDVSDLETFLADAPGYTVQPPRKLQGDRFTAVGQFGLDVEYYIAAPSDTERYTLRYGCHTPRTALHNRHVDEYQDLLQIRRADAGHYFVVLYPRPRNADAPSFETLGDGHIVKVSTDTRSDWNFLAATATEVAADDVTFKGTVGCIQKGENDTALTLGAPGAVGYDTMTLEADHAASVLKTADAVVTVRLPADRRKGGEVTLFLEGAWQVATPTEDVAVTPVDGGYKLVFSAGATQCTMRPE
ncbi:MAG: hypothetical protein K9N51_11400 [Candidatus Pacebacteria bacterium]|nr:hypothetical protein [Candidatus Paceibacterota bacterium]